MAIRVYDCSTFLGRLVVQVCKCILNICFHNYLNSLYIADILDSQPFMLDPGHGKVVAPVARLRNVNEFAKPCAVLVSVDEFESLLTRYVLLNSVYVRRTVILSC